MMRPCVACGRGFPISSIVASARVVLQTLCSSHRTLAPREQAFRPLSMAMICKIQTARPGLKCSLSSLKLECRPGVNVLITPVRDHLVEKHIGLDHGRADWARKSRLARL